jgi:hypothetical protein
MSLAPFDKTITVKISTKTSSRNPSIALSRTSACSYERNFWHPCDEINVSAFKKRFFLGFAIEINVHFRYAKIESILSRTAIFAKMKITEDVSWQLRNVKVDDRARLWKYLICGGDVPELLRGVCLSFACFVILNSKRHTRLRLILLYIS